MLVVVLVVPHGRRAHDRLHAVSQSRKQNTHGMRAVMMLATMITRMIMMQMAMVSLHGKIVMIMMQLEIAYCQNLSDCVQTLT